MAHNLRPFRQYSENDVVNLFAFSGDSTLVVKGLAVKVVGDGWTNEANSSPVETLGSVGASYNNVVSQRYGAKAKVAVAASGDAILGITLMDVRELDENGDRPKGDPREYDFEEDSLLDANEMEESFSTRDKMKRIIENLKAKRNGILLEAEEPSEEDELSDKDLEKYILLQNIV